MKQKLLTFFAALFYAASMGAAPAVAVNGKLPGAFSVSTTKRVQFSQGNLRATTSDLGAHWTWSFAENQYDYIGDATANTAINGNGTVSTNGTVDFFGWSTAATYFGIHNSTSDGTYSGDFVDWGTNAITNGGNTANAWRTLTSDEWIYLFNTRATTSGVRYARANVNGKSGVILLPDDWKTSYYTLSNTNTDNAAYTSNEITLADWTNSLEAHGAVFLPAAGLRGGSGVGGVGSFGDYWSATSGGTNTAGAPYFTSSSLKTQSNSYRNNGSSVRLVSETDPPKGPYKRVIRIAEGTFATFAQGNLQYQASTGTWRFAENQYDEIGNANSNISASYTGWIDMFGFGTGNNPTETAEYSSAFSTFTDWGVNPISNGGNVANAWRTPTDDEWRYVFFKRTKAKIKFGLGRVNGIPGVFILPENWNQPEGISFTPNTEIDLVDKLTYYDDPNYDLYDHNTFTLEQWNAMDAAGVVFLPAAGNRSGSSTYNVHSCGNYWSSTPAAVSLRAYYLDFYTDGSSTAYLKPQNCDNRHSGRTVRLLQVFATAPTAKTLTYTGSAQVLANPGTATTGEMLYSSDNSTWSTSIPTATNAGNHYVYYKITGDAYHDDFIPVGNKITVKIAKATPTVTAPTAKSLTYNGSAQELVNPGSTTGGEMRYTLTSGTGYSSAIPTATNAGTYTVYYKVNGNTNYNAVAEASVEVTINKADVALTAPTAIDGLVYNGAAQTLINAGTVTGGELQYKLDDGAYSTDLPQATTVGSYTIYYKVVGDANHNDVAESSFTVAIGSADKVLTANQDPNNPSDYYSTFFDSSVTYELPTGTEAYVAAISGATLTLTKIAEGGQVIPAANAVILKANSSSITLTPSDASPVSVDANDLQGTDAAISNPSYGSTYVLSAADGVVGFYKLSSGATIPAHKAYLTITGSLDAPRRLRFVFDATTGVDNSQFTIHNSQCTKLIKDGQLVIIRNGVEYNAAGQIVNQ